jgi:transposase
VPFQREKQSSMDLTDEQWAVLEPLIPDPPQREDGKADPGEILAMS